MDLGGRFIVWTRKRSIDPATEFDAQGSRFFDNNLLERRRIHGRHIRKARPKTFVVSAAQWIHSHEIQMIADYHQRTLAQLNINPACGVGQKERLDTEQIKCADR